MDKTLKLFSLAALIFLTACTTMPEGPSVLVLPGTGKSFDQFRADDWICRQFARDQVGGATSGSVASDSGIRSAALGTVIGAVGGAAIGGQRGAGVGAGTGLIMGSVAGTGAAQSSAYGLQQRYDFGFEQCMYSKGHRIPVSGRMTPEQPAAGRYYYPPPPPYYGR